MKLKENLEILIRPSYWIMNDRYNKHVDKAINDLLDNFEFEIIDEYTALLGGKEVWIANLPYACMYFYYGEFKNLRPSRKTILRAVRRLEEDTEGYTFKDRLNKYLSK